MRKAVRHANKSASPVLAGHRLGLIINPVAGMGGAVGLKGTDGPETLAVALARGAQPLAAGRTARALRDIAMRGAAEPLLAAPGPMGLDAARTAGLPAQAIGSISATTTGRDTERIAAEMAEAGAGLILFAGGDGTARDVMAGAPGVALLGIPSGVKMHSAVFAISPEAAGGIAGSFLADPDAMRWQDADVMDIDEALLRDGVVAARLYGIARAPIARDTMQRGKSPSRPADDAALEALADEIVGEMEDGRLYVLGCGATLRKVKRRLGADGTLLGVDIAMNGRLIATDVDAERLLRLTAKSPATVVVSVTGGQGFLFGRGNQQIGAALLKRVGRDGIIALCGARKLSELDPPVLRVDTGDPALDRKLAGYMRVRTAPGQSMMMKVSA
ncbi:MAG: ATP-NAD kinase family protein [Beijerinckiaceae bacterium]